MKKSILAAVLMLATVAAHAVTMPSSQAKVTVDPATSIGTWQTVPTNPSGTPQPTPFPGGQQTVLNGISGTAATSYFDKLTTSAAAGATAAKQDTAFGSQTTTAATDIYTNPSKITFGARSVGWVSLSQTAYTGLTPNATVTFNVTTTAASSAYTNYMVKITVESGVTSMRSVFCHSVAAPAGFSASGGGTFFPSDTPKTVGIPLISANPLTGVVPHLHVRPSALSGATSGTIFIEIFGQL